MDTDLSLYSLDDLVDEIKRRTRISLVCYEMNPPNGESQDKLDSYLNYSGGLNGALGLAVQIQDQLLRKSRRELVDEDELDAEE